MNTTKAPLTVTPLDREVFWLADREGNIVTPHLYNTSDEVVEWANQHLSYHWVDAGYRIRVA